MEWYLERFKCLAVLLRTQRILQKCVTVVNIKRIFLAIEFTGLDVRK